MCNIKMFVVGVEAACKTSYYILFSQQIRFLFHFLIQNIITNSFAEYYARTKLCQV